VSTARDNSEWRNRAACRDSDPDLFFPPGTTGVSLADIGKAKDVCRLCVVRGQCLQFALETNQETGVRGGTSEEERRRLRRTWIAGGRRMVALS
jgi:WhiB family redox-sensing transcriptional regulator